MKSIKKEADKQLIKKYQQGDVLLYKMPKRLFKECLTSNHIKIHPNEHRDSNKREIVLAFGEATGHAHVINAKPIQAQYWVTKKYNYPGGYWVEGKEATAFFTGGYSPQFAPANFCNPKSAESSISSS